jgi:hypothetical protein
MQLCCGKEQGTPFCCFCGKRLVCDPLVELLAHVRAKHASLTRETRLLGRRGEGEERIIAKWKRWLDALEAVSKPS